MKADPFQIGDVLKDQKQFIVPIYQRTYTWTKARQLDKFFDSIEGKARERLTGPVSSYPHYMGAILLSPRGKFSFGTTQMFDVVDGQQRLMTYQIFLATLRDLAKENGDAMLFNQITPFMLNTDTRLMKDSKTECYKLQASKFDRDLFRDLIDCDANGLHEKYPGAFYKNGKIREKDAPLPLRAWWFFRDEANKFAKEEPNGDSNNRLALLSAAILEDFRVIVITLDERDDSQVIFETLNSGGEPLAAMDLVRNDVFHRAIRNDEDVDALMDQKWSVFEDVFWKQEATHGRIKKPRIDFFLAHTLTAETGKEVLLGELYARYKAFIANRHFENVMNELTSLVKYAPTYRMLSAPNGTGPLADLARQLQIFDMSTAFPLVFVIADSDATDEVKAALYKAISSYIVRRALCGLTAKNYNNTFIRIAGHLRANGVSGDAFSSAFSDSDGESVKFPTDQELKMAISTRIQYGAIPTSILNYILCELEKTSRGKFDETIGLRTDLTIEHVLPQDWTEHWPLLDGSKAPIDYVVMADDPRHSAIATRQQLKHTLGNLTLLTPSGNPRLGNKPFIVIDDALGISKRDALRNSLLKMNQEIAAYDEWNESKIKERADILSNRAIVLWFNPSDIKNMT
jgi:uncharacterized protein with ParB-like and HNH nuclease domain